MQLMAVEGTTHKQKNKKPKTKPVHKPITVIQDLYKFYF